MAFAVFTMLRTLPLFSPNHKQKGIILQGKTNSTHATSVMFAQVHCPEILKPNELDAYLTRGWFRMGQTMFTTNFLNFKGQFYSAIWLRVLLRNYASDKNCQKISRQNSGFRSEIKRATITPEKEALYAAYKRGVSFEASASLNQLLYGKAFDTIFDTYEVLLYDNDKLIGAGFFDVGKNSAMGITSFYDPAYRKHSPGKHLIYCKMEYCQQLGMEYFYPGYFAPGYPLFDYKLSMGKPSLEFLQLRSQQWLPIGQFSPNDELIRVMNEKLATMHSLLESVDLQSTLLKYDFFYANQLPDLRGADLFDFPVFISCEKIADGLPPVIVFDTRDMNYHLLQCRSIWEPPVPVTSGDSYSSHLLKIDRDIFQTPDPNEIITLLKPAAK